MELFLFNDIICLPTFVCGFKSQLYDNKYSLLNIALSPWAVEYTDFTFAEGYPPPRNEYPGYDSKQSDG